jgi:hypothetical protein
MEKQIIAAFRGSKTLAAKDALCRALAGYRYISIRADLGSHARECRDC